MPGARAVMDPFCVVHRAGEGLDECHGGIQQELNHRCGRCTDPLCKACRVLHTRSRIHTSCRQQQILDLFTNEEHIPLELTWRVHRKFKAVLHHTRSKREHDPDIRQNQQTALEACAELPDRAHHAGEDTQTSIQGNSARLRPPLRCEPPHRSRQRLPRTPTGVCPRPCETLHTTSPERSSKPADPNLN